MDYTVDVSWPQGNYQPSSGVFIAATSGDGGSSDPRTLFTQKTFVEDITNARNNGDEAGFYHFNGIQDPTASADYFWSVISSYYQPGDAYALDVENGSGFSAVQPGWALAFAARLALNRGVTIDQLRLGIYGNRSTMSAPGWGALEAHGCWLWLAAPGGYPENTPIGEWSHWTILQYSSTGGVDRDESQLTFAQIMEDTMPLSDADISKLLNFPAFDGGPSFSQAIKDIWEDAEQPVLRDGKVVKQIQDEADTGTIVREILDKIDTLAATPPGTPDASTIAADLKTALSTLTITSTATTNG